MGDKRLGRPTDLSKDIAISKAARELLFEQGPEAVTMEGVAARARISKGTMYARYANRQQLLQSIVESESKRITVSIGRPPEILQDLKSGLLEFVEQLTAFLVSNEHLKLIEVVALPTAGMHKLKKQIYQNGPQKTLDTLAEYLESAAKTGLIHCPSPVNSAELLLGMMMGLDLVRASYGVPMRIKQKKQNKDHAQSIVSAFLILHQSFKI